MGFGMGTLIGMSVSYALLPGMGITDEFGVAHLIMFGTMLGAMSGFLQCVASIENGQVTENLIMINQLCVLQQLGSILTQRPMTLL